MDQLVNVYLIDNQISMTSLSYNVLHYVNIALGSGAVQRSLKAWACQKGCT